MLRGKTIIYFGPEPWDGLWRNRHQLMSRFAAHNNVWYVEPPIHFRRLLSGRKSRTRLCTTDSSGVRVFHSPWWLPVVGREPFKSLTLRLYLGVLSRLIKTNKTKPIIWVSRPTMIDYITRIDTELTIYHVVDEYSGYGTPTENQREKLKLKEERLLRTVDMTIVVTQSLFDLKVTYNANTFLIANAADFEAYANSGTTIPEDLQSIPKPIIGYTGLIAARLNLLMLIEAADAKPKWSFVFVGAENDDQCQDEMRQLKERENVYFLGQKSISDTPSYVAAFDVSIIPYTVNLRAQHASPLKLFEYAAASKPIVATDFAAARNFSGHINIARNNKEFVTHCEQAIAMEETDQKLIENKHFAADNTWDARIEQISKLIDGHGKS